MMVQQTSMKTLRELLCAVLVVPVCAGAYLVLGKALSQLAALPAARLSLPYAIGSGVISACIIVWLHVSGETKTLSEAMRVAAIGGIAMACGLLGYFAFTTGVPAEGMMRISIAVGVGALLILFMYLRQRAEAKGDELRMARGAGVIIGVGVIGGLAAMRLEVWQLLVVFALCASLFPTSWLLLVLRRGMGVATNDAR